VKKQEEDVEPGEGSIAAFLIFAFGEGQRWWNGGQTIANPNSQATQTTNESAREPSA